MRFTNFFQCQYFCAISHTLRLEGRCYFSAVSYTIILRDGSLFDFSNPEKSLFSIKVIAHALSNLCYASGHTRHFYSVAQHSFLVSNQVPKQYALSGMLYKSAQAFTGYLPSELAGLLPEHRNLELRVLKEILVQHELPPVIPYCVRQAARALNATVRRDLMTKCAEKNVDLIGLSMLDHSITPMFPTEACRSFLTRYLELTRSASHSVSSNERVSMY